MATALGDLIDKGFAMSSRTVAFLDILGFRKMVESQSAEDLGQKYTMIVGRSLPAINRKHHESPNEPTFFPHRSLGDAHCIMHVFSDSIILISHDDSELGSLALLISAWRMTQTLIGFKMPVRGAIAHGDMYLDTKNSLFLGRALTAAYDLESAQNWIGVAIDDSVPQTFPSLLVSEEPVPGLRSSLFCPGSAGNGQLLAGRM